MTSHSLRTRPSSLPPSRTRKLEIAVIGSGHLGLVNAACLARFGHSVVVVDFDAAEVARLEQGDFSFYETDLAELMQSQIDARTLRIADAAAANIDAADLIVLAVDTPTRTDGSTELRALDEAAQLVAAAVRAPCVIALKSTVPVGTAHALQARLDAACGGRDQAPHVLSAPEFARKGSAIADFMAPDRIVIGDDGAGVAARQRLLDAHAPLVEAGVPVLTMDTRSAELTKLAANAALAMRISFANEIAAIANAVGADIERVCDGMGSDRRIGREFLDAGAGYGGACFPRDVAALRETARRHNLRADLLLATERVNDRQRCWCFHELQRDIGSRDQMRQLRVAIWGLAFKPGTDDVRGAPALPVIDRLVRAGVCVTLYDPVAMDRAREVLSHHRRLEWATSAADALRGANALMLLTEWPEFVAFDPAVAAHALRTGTVYDGRNALDAPRWASAGVRVVQVGRSLLPPSERALHRRQAARREAEKRATAGLGVAA